MMDYLKATSIRQRVLLAFAIAVVAMFLFPPFVVENMRFETKTLQYGFVGDPPIADRRTGATVAYGMLLIQLVGATLVAAAALMFVRGGEPEHRIRDLDRELRLRHASR